VDVIAVGHGDSILITSAAGKRLLIDGGEAEAAPLVLALLQQRGACPLDLILLTHRHSDHLGGLASIVESCGTKAFMDSGYRHDTLFTCVCCTSSNGVTCRCCKRLQGVRSSSAPAWC
jgi:competence protein ComEC